MRLVFVGGTRFIGHAAACQAVARGHEVTLLHRGTHAAEVAGAREAIVDRRDPGALARAIAVARPDAVVDTLAMTKSDAETSALALRIAQVPAVILSSQDVYSAWGAVLGHNAPPTEAELDESSPLMDVRFPYRGKPHDAGEDYDKKDVEVVFRDATQVASCVLRLPAVFGRRDYNRRFGAIVDALDAGEALPCKGGASLRWTHAHVRDVGHAIVLAAEKVKRGFSVYNVGERTTPTMRARVEAIARAAKREALFCEAEEPLPEAFAVLGRPPVDLVARTTRIRDELGFAEITTEDERLRDLVAFCRETRT
jgi:nucleoside-diphosphate-sugar epimerase